MMEGGGEYWQSTPNRALPLLENEVSGSRVGRSFLFGRKLAHSARNVYTYRLFLFEFHQLQCMKGEKQEILRALSRFPSKA